MAAGAAVIGGLQLASAYGQSQTMLAQADYQKRMLDINARNSDMAADKAIERGDIEASNYQKKVKQVAGSQRAGFASQGVQVDKGSAAEIVAETYDIGAQDVISIKNNAFLEAMGYKQQAFNYAQQGRVAQISATSQAGQTLVAGGLQAANTAYSAYGPKGGGK